MRLKIVLPRRALINEKNIELTKGREVIRPEKLKKG